MMNSLYAMYEAARSGAGLAMLPDYLAHADGALEMVLPAMQPPGVEMYFVYPEERRHSQRIAIFRDFLVSRIAETKF
jgi:DNA-binding transcriptional LysR family regulator